MKKQLLLLLVIFMATGLLKNTLQAQSNGSEYPPAFYDPSTGSLYYGPPPGSGSGTQPGGTPLQPGQVIFIFPNGSAIVTDPSGHYVAGGGIGQCIGCPPPENAPPPPPPPPNPPPMDWPQNQPSAGPGLYDYYYNYFYNYYLPGGGGGGSSPATYTPYTPTNVLPENPGPCTSADFNGVSNYVTPSGKPFTLPPGTLVHTSPTYDYDIFPNGALYMFTLPDGTKYAAYTRQYVAPTTTIAFSAEPEFLGYYKLNADGTWAQPMTAYPGSMDPPTQNPDGSYNTVRMYIQETPSGTCKLVKEVVKFDRSTTDNGIATDDAIMGSSPVPGMTKCEKDIPCPNPYAPSNMPPAVPNIDNYLNSNSTDLKNFLRDFTKNSVKMYLYDCATGKVQYTLTKNGMQTLTAGEQDAVTNKFNNGTFTSTDEDIAIKGCLSNGKWKYDVKLNPTKLNPHAKVAPVLQEVIEEIKRQAAAEVGPLKDANTVTKEERYPAGNEEFYKKSMNLLKSLAAIYDIGKDIINDGKMPDKIWDKGVRSGPADQTALENYNKSPLHLPTYPSGGTDQLIDEVTGTIQLVKTGYEFIRHPKKTFQTIWQGVSNIDAKKMKEFAKDLSGANNYDAGGDRAKYQAGKHTIQAAMIIFTGVKTLTKGTAVVKDAGSNMNIVQGFVPHTPNPGSQAVYDAVKNAQNNGKLIRQTESKLITKNVDAATGTESLVIIERKSNTPEVFKTTGTNNLDEIPENAIAKADGDDLVEFAENPNAFNDVKVQPEKFIQGKKFETDWGLAAASDPAIKAQLALKAGLPNLDGYTQLKQVQLKLTTGGYTTADYVWVKPKVVGTQTRYDVVIAETKLSGAAPMTGRQDTFVGQINSGTTSFDLRNIKFEDPDSNLLIISQNSPFDVQAFIKVTGDGTGSVAANALTYTKL